MEDVELFGNLGGLPDMRETKFEPHSFSNLRHTTTHVGLCLMAFAIMHGSLQ